MPNLIEQLGTTIGDVDITVDIGGEVGKIVALVDTVAGLIDNPPAEFAAFLQSINELELPDFGGTADFTAVLAQLDDVIPTEIAEVAEPVFGGLNDLDNSLVAAINEVIGPAITTIQSLVTLLQEDITCGLLDGEESAGGGGVGGGGGAGTEGGGAGGGAATDNGAASQANIDNAKAALDLLPTPLTVENLLKWLSGFVGGVEIPYILMRAVPVFDDIRDPLATVVAWDDMSGDDIVVQFANTLTVTGGLLDNNVAGLVQRNFEAIDTQLTALDLARLDTQIGSLIVDYQAIVDAVQANDVSSIGPNISAINATLAQLETAHASYTATIQAPFEQALVQFQQLPDQLEDQLVQMISLLQPRAGLQGLLGDVAENVDIEATAFEPLEDLFGQIEQSLGQILDAIDLSVVFTPLSQPLAQAQQAIEHIDQQIVMLTLEVKQRFLQVEQLLDAFNAAALLAQVEAAIDGFISTLHADLNSAFAPVRDALQTAADGLSIALADFDPEVVRDAIQTVMDSISAVFQQPAFQDALAQLQQLQQAAEKLEEISFTPVTDGVIAGIDEIKEALDAIDETTLQAPLPGMLGAAMSALPQSITPLTDPLVDALDEIIESGPVSVLEAIKDAPAAMFNEVRKYEPEKLLGDSLSKPYQDLLEKVEDYSPSELLGQLEVEFEKLKQRLVQEVNPGQAFQPLVAVHDSLMQNLARFQPGELIEPVNQAVQRTVNTVVDALPLDDVLGPLDSVIGDIRGYADMGERVVGLIQHLIGKLGELADAETQLNAWLDGVFNKIPEGAPTPALADALQGLVDAVNNTRSGPLDAAISTRMGTLQADLASLNPQQKLTQLVQTVGRISRGDVVALPPTDPPSNNIEDLLNLLDNTDVTAPAVSGIYRELGKLQQLCTTLDAGFSEKFEGWDERHHAPGSTLSEFVQPGADVGQIKQWIRGALDAQLMRPLLGVLSKVGPTVQLLTAFSDFLDSAVVELQAKVEQLLLAPAALSDLGNNIDALLDRLRGINLDLVQEALDTVFDNVRGQLNELSPRTFQRAVDEKFADALATLSFNAIVSDDALAGVDASFRSFVNDLQLLDPDSLLLEPLQELFEENLKPLVDAFDITPFIQAVIDRLEPLDDELRAELDRVDVAYQEMLRAAPPLNLSVSLQF